jgi:hypothetical protein
MLTKCKDDIRGHLSNCHLSWENIEEHELISGESTGEDVGLPHQWGLPSSHIGEGMASSSFVSVSNSSIRKEKSERFPCCSAKAWKRNP